MLRIYVNNEKKYVYEQNDLWWWNTYIAKDWLMADMDERSRIVLHIVRFGNCLHSRKDYVESNVLSSQLGQPHAVCVTFLVSSLFWQFFLWIREYFIQYWIISFYVSKKSSTYFHDYISFFRYIGISWMICMTARVAACVAMLFRVEYLGKMVFSFEVF